MDILSELVLWQYHNKRDHTCQFCGQVCTAEDYYDNNALSIVLGDDYKPTKCCNVKST